MIDLEKEIRGLHGPLIVFGAGGFLGANLFRCLLEYRRDVFAVTHQNYVPWRLLGIPEGHLIQCDITKEYSVQEALQNHRFQTYFCFSAYGAYARQSNPLKIYQTNVLGLANVLANAEPQGFAALVHAGSSSEYGLNCAAPKEDDAMAPNSHYAVSKVAAAQLIKFLGEQRGLPVINLRYYSVYGRREESDRLIPCLLSSALEGKLPKLTNPETTRDFVYIDDAVAAAILAASRGVKAAPGASLNIASGQKTTLRELVAITKEAFSLEQLPTWGTMSDRSWDTKEWFGNPKLAKKVMGWEARTDLRSGLVVTGEWMKEQGRPPEIIARVDEERPVRLSAIIACYRDALAIPVMHERLTNVFRKMAVDYEIIFVNDSSPDNSDQVLTKICAHDPHVVAIEHSRNFGSQSAFLSGMDISTGHAVILMDGDMQDPPEIIPEFFVEWRNGFEVVYGRRIRRETTPLLAFLYKAFYRVFRSLAYIPIPVDAGDFSLIDRKVVKQLKQFPETDQFLRGLRAWVGFKQTGVDYFRPERMFGKSTNNWRKNIWWARKAIFNFSFIPLEALLYTGAFLTAVAVLGLFGQLLYRIYHPELPHGITTIIMLTFLFGGGNILAISILGEYVSKVFEETKRRPKFIRRAIRSGAIQLVESEAMDEFVISRKYSVGIPRLKENPI